jgi:hypothetical protein
MCEKELDLLPRRAWFARQKNGVLGGAWDGNGEFSGGDGGGGGGGGDVMLIVMVTAVMVMISCMGWGIKG